MKSVPWAEEQRRANLGHVLIIAEENRHSEYNYSRSLVLGLPLYFKQCVEVSYSSPIFLRPSRDFLESQRILARTSASMVGESRILHALSNLCAGCQRSTGRPRF